MASSINAITTGSGGVVTTADNSGDLNLQSGGSTKIAVTSAGVAVTGLSKGSLPTGSVLQVVNASYATETSITSTSYVDTGLTATITPTSATSKILIIISQNLATIDGVSSGAYPATNIVKNSTQLIEFPVLNNRFPATNAVSTNHSLQYYDSPASTSALTYKTQFKSSNGGQVKSQYGPSPSIITLMEIAA
jgi:hypothetical protein